MSPEGWRCVSVCSLFSGPGSDSLAGNASLIVTVPWDPGTSARLATTARRPRSTPCVNACAHQLRQGSRKAQGWGVPTGCEPRRGECAWRLPAPPSPETIPIGPSLWQPKISDRIAFIYSPGAWPTSALALASGAGESVHTLSTRISALHETFGSPGCEPRWFSKLGALGFYLLIVSPRGRMPDVGHKPLTPGGEAPNL